MYMSPAHDEKPIQNILIALITKRKYHDFLHYEEKTVKISEFNKLETSYSESSWFLFPVARFNRKIEERKK